MQLGIDLSLDWSKEIGNRRIAPTGRKEKQAGLEQRDRKQKNCYNEQKREASWIGGNG